MEPALADIQSQMHGDDELKENIIENKQVRYVAPKPLKDPELVETYASSYEAIVPIAARAQKHLDEVNRRRDSLRQDIAAKSSTLGELNQTLQDCLRQVAELEVNSHDQASRRIEQVKAIKARNLVNAQSNSEQAALLVAFEEEYDNTARRNEAGRAEAARQQACRADKLDRLADLALIYSTYQAFINKVDNAMIHTQQELKAKHNYLQELQGNIRVFCRMRPLIHSDSGAMSAFQINDSSISLAKQGKLFSFNFDRVFGPEATQADIFEEVSQLVRSALDGYKVCIFAYGQTGSGKTHTMEGPGGTMDGEKGIIQRSVEQIFEAFAVQEKHGWTYQAEISCIEVYNEQVQDLLEGSKKMTAFSTNMLLPTTLLVRDPSELYPILNKARHQRAAAHTMCNERSSRSHSLFTLKLTGYHAQSQTETCGALNLIDLAGSERLKRSRVEGDRLEETKSINKSLACLSDVIQAIAKKEKHIPFRNSKLTHLLQGHLGNESKTLMFVNVSPLEANLKESISSLRFASQVNSCQLGRAQRQARTVIRVD
jgi:kinesin family protein C1